MNPNSNLGLGLGLGLQGDTEKDVDIPNEVFSFPKRESSEFKTQKMSC